MMARQGYVHDADTGCGAPAEEMVTLNASKQVAATPTSYDADIDVDGFGPLCQLIARPAGTLSRDEEPYVRDDEVGSGSPSSQLKGRAF